MNTKILSTALALLLVSGAAIAASTTAPGSSPADQALRALIAEEWADEMHDDPLYATQAGVRDFDDRLPSVTPADHARQDERNQHYLRRLATIDRKALSSANRSNYDIFDFVIHNRVALDPYQEWRIPLTADEGFHIEVMRMAAGIAMTTPRDYENYIARLRAIPAYFEQQEANMRFGLKAGLHAAGGDPARHHQDRRRPAIHFTRPDAVLRTVHAHARYDSGRAAR